MATNFRVSWVRGDNKVWVSRVRGDNKVKGFMG